ncbi:zinc finger MYM-type protein 5-like [Episyrphus balteatus]|uniref:zinc finger MYM-type protein 5-like n=1 Tax=Episyrphus balteatus TaxID=286459 RepID=UPI0024850AC0|nr:zinc finger MYM-type protein 5-like [Episyrphus balteatus]
MYITILTISLKWAIKSRPTTEFASYFRTASRNRSKFGSRRNPAAIINQPQEIKEPLQANEQVDLVQHENVQSILGQIQETEEPSQAILRVNIQEEKFGAIADQLQENEEPSKEISDTEEQLNTASKSKDFPELITDPAVKKQLVASGARQPRGPFPIDKKSGRVFFENYYWIVSKSGLKLNRSWLSYSTEKNVVYCFPCWLFSERSSFNNPWSSNGIQDWKHLSERIKFTKHQRFTQILARYTIAEKKNNTVDMALQKSLRDEQNFWRKVLKRILDVTMMLATCNLAFRGKNEKMGDSNKGNFLSVIELLARCDPILTELLERPATCKIN